MRICYVCHGDSHFLPPYVDFFSARGHEIHVVSLYRKDMPNAVNHHPLRRDFDPMKAGPIYFFAAFSVRAVIRRIRPDIVHAHYLTSNGLMAALSGFHPLVVSARGTDVYGALGHRIKPWILRFTMKRADLVNPVSADLERRIRELGVPPGKILCLPQGIEASRFAADRTARRPGPVRLICTRKLMPVYQPRRIVAALEIAAKRGLDFECTFAATGPLEPELRGQVEAAGLTHRIRFLGGYSPDALPALLADSDIFVSASLWDGTSPALLEAMASGSFPVVSDIPANREWLTGNGDGLFFDPSSTEGLADALAQAARDEALRRGAVEVNRDRVARRGNRDTNLSCLADQYDRLVAAARSGALNADPARPSVFPRKG